MENTYILECLDNRKSFYDKARVHVLENGTQQLESYETIVCECDVNGNFRKLWDGYSATTQRHVNSFILHTGCNAECGKKYWDGLEVKK